MIIIRDNRKKGIRRMRIRVIKISPQEVDKTNVSDVWERKERVKDRLWCICNGYKNADIIYSYANCRQYADAIRLAEQRKGKYVGEIIRCINALEELEKAERKLEEGYYDKLCEHRQIPKCAKKNFGPGSGSLR